MKSYSKNEILEKLKNIGDNQKEVKEYAKSLYYVDFGTSVFDRTSNGGYFLEKDEVKKEFDYDFNYCKENKYLYTDTTISNLKVNKDITKDLSGFLDEVEEKKHLVNLMRINNETVEKVTEINDLIESFNGAFKIEQDTKKIKATIYDLDKGTKDYEFSSREFDSELDRESIFFVKALTDFLNKNKEERVPFSKEFLKNLVRNNDKTVIYIDGENPENNSCEIIKNDEKIVLLGEEFDFGRMSFYKNYGNNIFNMEEKKIQKHLVKPYEMENTLDNLREELIYGSFNMKTIRDYAISSILNDDELIEKTNHFTENTKDLKYNLIERFEEIFSNLGDDFTEVFMKRHAGTMGLSVVKDKVAEVLEMGSIEDYSANLKEFTKEMYMSEVEMFDKKISKGNIENNFNEFQIEDSRVNPFKKIDKIYENIYKYITDEEKQKEIGKPSPKTFSTLAKKIGLEISPYSDKYEKLNKKFESTKDKEISKEENIDIEKETKKEIEFQ